LGRGKAPGRREPGVDFSEITVEAADFRGFIFPGPANFKNAHFTHDVSFEKAKFKGVADFTGAKFPRATRFCNAHFSHNASFEKAEFKNDGDFTEAKFSKRARFSEARFNGLANFPKAIFQERVFLDRIVFAKDVSFSFAHFEQWVYAPHTHFCKYATFKGATFKNGLFLNNSKFCGETIFNRVTFNRANFYGVNFKHPLTKFLNSRFERSPDFRASIFAAPPYFQGAKFCYANRSGLARLIAQAADKGDAAKYRRLKQMASDAKDHEGELRFFAMELRAKRVHETHGFWANATNVVYGSLSDFGRSVARSLICLLILTTLSAVAILGDYSSVSSVSLMAISVALLLPYLGRGVDRVLTYLTALALFAVATMVLACSPTLSVTLAAANLSITNAALLVGADKWVLREVACQVLYHSRECKFGLLVDLLPYLQSLTSLFLAFLFGLGLRNRFRIGTS